MVDTKSHKIVKTIQLGQAGLVKPMAVLLSPDAKRLYVSTGRGRTVFTIDTATNKVLGSVEVGKRPWGIALSPDGTKLYSANGPSNDVSEVDLATNTVTRKFKAGEGPWGIVVLK
jgi:YVTN family beta-propeller protein